MAKIDDVAYWHDEIHQALKRDKRFRKEGQRINEIYECDDDKKVPFNILYSNTDTLLPALYSATPRPKVKRRFNDNDPLGMAIARASTRMLEYLLDTNIDGYDSFDDAISYATLDGLLPGRGVTRIKYDAEVEGDQIKLETICLDHIVWDRVLFGYAKKWANVPWIAFEEHIDKEEAKRLGIDEEVIAKLRFTTGDEEGEDKNEQEENEKGGQKTTCIYQIWDKTTRMIRLVSTNYADDFLKEPDEDPLQLANFFPIPKPLQFFEKSSDLCPTAPYHVYEAQAKELNELTKRITRLSTAIKAKGIYDGSLGSDIENLMKGDDNTFIPADKSSALAAERGFQNAIWFMPIEQMVATLQTLYQSRESCKQTIYEITGISDIIRGATDANETATAQGIKSQWGTMRLKRSQKRVQTYARDLLRIMLEIAATKFSPQTWSNMTGLQLQEGEWAQVLQMLQNDMQRSYKIDIETNSTILPEAAEDQKNISDAMQAFGQYLQGVTPLVQSGAFPFEAAKAMMMTVVRRFQFGDEIEQFIEQMQPPQPPPDNTMEIEKMRLDNQANIANTNAQKDKEIAQNSDNMKILLARMDGKISPEDVEQMIRLKNISNEIIDVLNKQQQAIEQHGQMIQQSLLPKERILVRDQNGRPVSAYERTIQ